MRESKDREMSESEDRCQQDTSWIVPPSVQLSISSYWERLIGDCVTQVHLGKNIHTLRHCSTYPTYLKENERHLEIEDTEGFSRWELYLTFLHFSVVIFARVISTEDQVDTRGLPCLSWLDSDESFGVGGREVARHFADWFFKRDYDLLSASIRCGTNLSVQGERQ